MNDTAYAVMAIGDLNNTDHMDRIENDADVWTMTREEAVALRDTYRANGHANIVAVRRTVCGVGDIRFAVI
jgi:hypothetical protein